MVLVSDDGGDDAVLVHHADVGAVGEEGLAVGRHRHPFGIGQSGIGRLAAVAASVGVPGQAAGARPDEGVPVRVQFGARDLGGRVTGTQREVGQLLEADDLSGNVELLQCVHVHRYQHDGSLLLCLTYLMCFWLRNVEGLLLFQLVVVGAVGQVVAVRDTA